MTYPVPDTWHISGKISCSNGNPFTIGIIRAFHVSNESMFYLGESGINEDGSYQITYSSANFQNGDTTIQNPNVVMQLQDYHGNKIWESPQPMVFESQQTFSFVIDDEQEPCLGENSSSQENLGAENEYVVYGRVVNKSGRPLQNVYVHAVCLDFLNTEKEQSFKYLTLNTQAAITDKNGCYEIVYSPLSLPRRIQNPSAENPKEKISILQNSF